jgi:thiol-disulfide isomerase/thioredoxin
MMGMSRPRWGLALPLLLSIACVAQAAPRIGEPSPVDLLGTTPEGEDIRISEHRGKVLVVSFWASWCGYCRKQFPLLDYLQATVGTDDLRVVVVNFKEAVSDYRGVRRTLRKSSVTWTHDRSGEISDALGVNSVPAMFIFDRAGDLAEIRRGYSESHVEPTVAIINELLAEAPPVAAVTAAEVEEPVGR